MSRPESQANTQATVSGERSTPIVNSVRSLQSRVSSLLAAALMIALGVGALSWYYANALGRQKRLHDAAVASVANNAQGEMPLPSLGTVVGPEAGASAHISDSATHREVLPASTFGGPAPAAGASPQGTYADLPTRQGSASWNNDPGSSWSAPGSVQPYGGGAYAVADTYRSTQRQGVTDRRLSGAAFSRETGQSSPPPPAVGLGSQPDANLPPFPGSRTALEQGTSADGLGTLLRPRITTPARAELIPTQQFLLPKGAFIDCTLETAIDSTLPGMTTCVTATDTFGVNGKVVLLERGSKLIGETRGEVQNGAARIFVLWTEARTPTGVLVPLDSPGTDELGRSGLPGQVNRHFWDRFGAAMLISVINGAMQAAVQSTSHGGAIIYNPSTSQEALTDVLKGTINIAPTVIKHQGDRIQILVARDIDFRPVYELRTAGF
jgi:type IV secretion system protein VirB10